MDKAVLALALAGIPFLKPAEKLKVMNNLDNLKALTLLSIEDISFIVGRLLRTTQWRPDDLERRVERSLAVMKAWRIRWCLAADESYPPLLGELYDPPFALFWRGDIGVLKKTSAAVVGTRGPSRAGYAAARSLGSDLAREGVVVVSGLACGIDAAAHDGAVSAGGLSAAVLASGVDQIYPTVNRPLAARMLERGGCLLSEYLPGEEPLKWRFPQRNRLISGLASAVIVVEAPGKSGALITAEYALEQGRDVGVHAICLGDSPEGEGGRRYIDDGASVVRSGADVVAMICGG